MTSPFALFPMPVASGLVAISPLPGRWGRLSEDLAEIARWKPSLVITMTTPDELKSHGVPGLGARLAAIDAAWWHFPVADYDVPSPEVAAGWHEVSGVSQAVLTQGGKVLIHCMGGCGRSGMAALRLMIDVGEIADSALSKLRAVRPGAIETDAQMRWATQR